MKKFIALALFFTFFSCTEQDETCECAKVIGGESFTIEYPCEYSSPCD